MSELENMRPEVREAVALVDFYFNDGAKGNGWPEVRGELLRLAARNAELEAKATRDHAWISDLLADNKRAEAELAAIKARIAEAKRVRLGTYPAHGSGYVQIIAEPREGDQTFRLLVDEPPAERGDR